MDKLLYISILLLIIVQRRTGAVTNPASLEYVKTSCQTTLHPAVCVNTLSTYANSIQGNDQYLAKAAIAVSLTNAKSTVSYLSKMSATAKLKPRESQALSDCVSSMNSCVTSLTQSVQELGKMGQFKGQNFVWHMSNVKTWVSSALTNQNICTGGFFDSSMNGRVKDDVNKKMSFVTQITSNALALVNGFATKHKKVTHKP